MRRSAALVGLLLLACLAAVPAGAGEGSVRRVLPDDDKRQIAASIDDCAANDLEPEKIRDNMLRVIWAASGRRMPEPDKAHDGIEAAMKLAGERDEAVAYTLEYGLDGERRPMARMSAIEALAVMGRHMSPAARTRCLAALNETIEFDPVYSVRRHAARAIAGFGNAELLVRLYREMPDFDGQLRRDILKNDSGQLKALATTIGRALRRFPNLMERLDSSDQDLRQRATLELQRLTGDDYRRTIAEWKKWWKEKLDRGEDRPDSRLLGPGVNLTADRVYMLALIELAGLIEAKEAVDGLSYAMDHAGTAETMAAATVLGNIGGPRAIERLHLAAKDRDDWVRAAAAEALAKADPKNSVEIFTRLLEDWAPKDATPEHRTSLVRVRRAAVTGLIAAGARQSAPRLAELLASPEANRQLSRDIIEALSRLGTSSELPALVRYGSDATAAERRAVIAAISEICKREPEPAALKGRRLDAATPAELQALAAGRDAAAGIAAVCELDRRDAAAYDEDGMVRALRGAGTTPTRTACLMFLGRRRWSPAVAELARAASASRAERAVAIAACAATAEVGNQEAIDAWKKSAAGHAVPDFVRLQQEAIAELVRLMATPQLGADVTAACAEAMAAVAPPKDQDPGSADRAVEALIGVLLDERRAAAFPTACAALRRLTDEDFGDAPGPWRTWYRAQQSLKEPVQKKKDSR